MEKAMVSVHINFGCMQTVYCNKSNLYFTQSGYCKPVWLGKYTDILVSIKHMQSGRIFPKWKEHSVNLVNQRSSLLSVSYWWCGSRSILAFFTRDSRFE